MSALQSEAMLLAWRRERHTAERRSARAGGGGGDPSSGRGDGW
jgi:hypothetical protein